MALDLVREFVHITSLVLEIAGVAVILIGFTWALVRSINHWRQDHSARHAYFTARRIFGRSILLSLEVLVAADLVRTIALEPTIANLTVFGFLILIRTLLSWSLDVELEGVWPWQKRRVVDDEQLSGIHYNDEA